MTEIGVGAESLILFVAGNGARLVEGAGPGAFGYGGCAVLACGLKPALQDPWREMKAAHFGGADRPLPEPPAGAGAGQEAEAGARALETYFRRQPFFRFAALIRDPQGLSIGGEAADRAYKALAPALVQRYGVVVERCAPTPKDVTVVFEGPGADSKLAEQYFGRLRVRLGATAVAVRHCFMPPAFGEPGLEVARVVVACALAGAGDGGTAAWPVDPAILFPDPGTYVEIDGAGLAEGEA